VRDYLQRIGGKTASLFATACQGGAVVAQESEEWIEALRVYGHNFGMAFQIVDDILDLTGDEAEMGKPVGSDLMQGTLTLPALILMDRYPEDNPVQKFLASPSKELLAPAVEAIRDSDIPQESYKMARDFCASAHEALSVLPDGAARQALYGLTDYVLERRS
jgi:geranylgeranyl pyrophosphate synthase